MADVLSLAIARLLHRKPRFAILDECTSAVTADMERRLYRICQENGITYISIAHRPALRVFHDQLLAIGDGACGFSLTQLDRKAHYQEVIAAARASVVPAAVEASIAAHAAARSAPYAFLAEQPALPERGALARVAAVCRVGLPGWPVPWPVLICVLGASIVTQIWCQAAVAIGRPPATVHGAQGIFNPVNLYGEYLWAPRTVPESHPQVPRSDGHELWPYVRVLDAPRQGDDSNGRLASPRLASPRLASSHLVSSRLVSSSQVFSAAYSLHVVH
jgi:hypothetical protein